MKTKTIAFSAMTIIKDHPNGFELSFATLAHDTDARSLFAIFKKPNCKTCIDVLFIHII